MKKNFFNPYAKTKTTTSNDRDEYDYTVVSEIEDMAIQEYVLMVSANPLSANTFADTMNHDDAGPSNLYYPETLSDEQCELINDQGEEDQRSFEEELYRLGLQEIELPETTLTATQLNRNESKRCALRRFFSNKTSTVITSYWSIRIGLWLQWLGRQRPRFRFQRIADTLSQAVTHFNAHISEINVELSETTKQLEEEKQQHQISKNSLTETKKERESLEERVTLLEASTCADKGEIQELTDTNKNLKDQSQGIRDELLEEKRKHNEAKVLLEVAAKSLEERVTLLEASTCADKGEIQELTDTNKNLKDQSQGIRDELLEEKRKHNEAKVLLEVAEGKVDVFASDFSDEVLGYETLVAEKKFVVAAKGEVTQQYNTFRLESKEEYDSVNQKLIGIKKLAKDGNLIGYENQYGGQRYDEKQLVSFTDDILAKFRECKLDDEPAPHPFPISQNPGTAAEMVDIIREEYQYIDTIRSTPALYISVMNYAFRKFDKPFKIEKFMLFLKDFAFNRARYEKARTFYQRDANQQTGVAAGAVVPTAAAQSTPNVILPSPLKASPTKVIKTNNSKKRKQSLPTHRPVLESKITKLWKNLTDDEKKFATVLEYTERTWDACAIVPAHAIPWENLSKDQQEAVDYLFEREKWEKNVTLCKNINPKKVLNKKKTKKTKTTQFPQRLPVPGVQDVKTESRVEANRIQIIDGEHFFIHSVTDSSYPTGVLLSHYDNKEHVRVYDCPYCMKVGIHPSGATMHINSCSFNPHRRK